MKQSRFSDQQVVRILEEADKGEQTITDICREHGISQATFYSWRRRFQGMNVETLRELKRLQRENARLKKLLADRELEIDALEEVMRKKL